MTETEAERAVQAGDADGLTFLVTAYELKAMRVAFAITGDRSQAEDVVADAFLAVHQQIERWWPGIAHVPGCRRRLRTRAQTYDFGSAELDSLSGSRVAIGYGTGTLSGPAFRVVYADALFRLAQTGTYRLVIGSNPSVTFLIKVN
jgi:hypothetical protein